MFRTVVVPPPSFGLVLPSLLVPFRGCCFGAAFPSWVVRHSPFSSLLRLLWVVLLSAPSPFGCCWFHPPPCFLSPHTQKTQHPKNAAPLKRRREKAAPPQKRSKRQHHPKGGGAEPATPKRGERENAAPPTPKRRRRERNITEKGREGKAAPHKRRRGDHHFTSPYFALM